MLRSLYSGVSGLNANMVDLDVIGNNIANSNTVGFKGSRVTFQEMLTQTLQSATRPSTGGRGGTNPQQIGLGALVGNISADFGQGDLRSTGVKTDLAIQGQGFFVMSDGTATSYTRAGAFGLDADFYLVDPSTGLKVQGRMADADGVIQPGALQDLFVDPTSVMPASASDAITLFGNLDADSDALGTELNSTSFLARAGGDAALTGLRGENGTALALAAGDRIAVTGSIDGTAISAGSFTVGTTGSTLADLAAWLNTNVTGVTFAVDATGALQATNASGGLVTGLRLTSSAKDAFNQNFRFDTSIADGATGLTSELRSPATASTLLTEAYNLNGDLLNLTADTSVLEITGSRGTTVITPYQVNVGAGTTLGDLLSGLQEAFGLSETAPILDDEGRIQMTGDVGTASALGDVSIAELGTSNTALATAMNFTQTQQARDAGTASVATTVYDSLGATHTLRFTFNKVAGENAWTWAAATEGDEEILSGGTGQIRFTDAGLVSSFTFDGGSSTLTLSPQASGAQGAQPLELTIDFGQIGGVNGLTQFASSSDLESQANGFTVGTLVDYEIDQNGIITGRFSNDTMRNLGQIAIATFNNPNGLLRDASNTYRASGNSGDPVTGFASQGSGVTLAPGTLESSNVDLAEQFTRLVIAQRAFQANARVITTGDQILQELVSILR